ncbi:AAA family ATPase [Acidithiobacillus sp.]|uniref:AAA family ATPase n=1 Tax=Acidithiobacillus sp. TaxID=1872118 RepID=UPI00262F1FE7|nr:AAA family ATPase [Acidithiobacillus sp.]
MASSNFITRVVLRNYKSIATCDVQLGPLTYLVGANGSGKSNFLDALHLARDAQQLPDKNFNVLPPIRVRRDRFLNRDDEFRRMLLLATQQLRSYLVRGFALAADTWRGAVLLR